MAFFEASVIGEFIVMLVRLTLTDVLLFPFPAPRREGDVLSLCAVCGLFLATA
jgi:hypothetical protein